MTMPALRKSSYAAPRLRAALSTIAADRATNDRALAGVGAVLGIAAFAWLLYRLIGAGHGPLLIAPVGAAAVLVFAVPASPLAQPWALFGGGSGYGFVLMPVAVGTALLFLTAWCYHRFSGHSYPHVAPAAPVVPDSPLEFGREDLIAAIDDYPDILDVNVDDLERVLYAAEQRALNRRSVGR
jgi:CBS domain-containing membrane protein